MSTGIITGNMLSMGLIEVSINPGSVAANTSGETTVTVPGLRTTDFVWVNKPTLEAGYGIVGCRVSGADTLAVTFMNTTAGALDEPAETYILFWARSERPAPTRVVE